jgi:hypothetical protein
MASKIEAAQLAEPDEDQRRFCPLWLQRVVRRPESFRKALTAFITHTLGQKYNGTSAPRLVLFSLIAHEKVHDYSLRDGT